MSDFNVLFRKFMEQSCSEQEKETLFAMIADGEHDAAIYQMIDSVIEETDEIVVADDRADEILSALLHSIPRQKKRSKMIVLIRWAAAAVLLTGTATLYFLQPVSTSKNQQQLALSQDVQPASQGAILTLGDGHQVVLDSVQKGVLANQGGTQVVLSHGTVSYDVQGAGTISYNTLSTPKGKLFHLVLPDGSEVWLNAASAVTYPTSFTGKERTVTLKGEAYFDIKPDAAMPFRVKMAENADVKVLGTAFNINAYGNENVITTTLINGRILVNNSRELKPGDQAIISAGRIDVSRTDTSRVLAWKNGLFNFEDADIQTVMKQLERWYDIEVQYENGIPVINFGGKMDRNLSLSGIIRILEISGVHSRLEGKKLIIRK
jgi:ferric-dicitrate binding protein FerR (iron transport regulator)